MKKNNNQLLMTVLKGRTFIVLIILVIFFSFASSSFLQPSTLTMVAKHVALYGILALGMTFVIITGGIDLSVGSVVGLTGMLAGGLIQEGLTIGNKTIYFSVPAIIVLMLIGGCLIGLINGLIITKLNVAAFIATLGTMYICRGLANLRSMGATFSNISGYAGLGNVGIKSLGTNWLGVPAGIYVFAVLAAAVGASKIQTFIKITFMNAMPQVFTGIKLGCIFSVIGAISADFVGGKIGMGTRITYYTKYNATAVTFGCIILVAIVGLVLYYIIEALERKVVLWKK